MKIKSFVFILNVFIFFTSCKKNTKNNNTAKETNNTKTKIADKHNSLNALFVGNTLLHGHSILIQKYLDKYLIDSCENQIYDDSTLIQTFERPKRLGDLNNNHKIDSVFVLPPLNFCEDGQSYYFTDPILPRLQTDSYWCHPSNLFSVGDIDENGVCEIGEYYSSCASRYKLLCVYSLINAKWEQVGQCTFDLGYSKYNINFKSYVRKTGKGNFQMLEITDLTEDTSKIGKKNWLEFKL
jgi:hypothetical protein